MLFKNMANINSRQVNLNYCLFRDRSVIAIFLFWLLSSFSIILAYPFLKLRYGNLLIGLLFIFLGTYLKGFVYNFYWLVWLGFRPIQFCTVDYFPLLPWFGVVLMEIFFANLLYPDYSRKFQLSNLFSLLIDKNFLLFREVFTINLLDSSALDNCIAPSFWYSEYEFIIILSTIF